MKKLLVLFIMGASITLASSKPSTCNGLLNDLDIVTESMSNLKSKVEKLQIQPTKADLEQMFLDITDTKSRIQHLFLYHPNELGDTSKDFKNSYESLTIIEKNLLGILDNINKIEQ